MNSEPRRGGTPSEARRILDPERTLPVGLTQSFGVSTRCFGSGELIDRYLDPGPLAAGTSARTSEPLPLLEDIPATQTGKRRNS